MTKNEICLCGLATVRARFQRDPASIQRLFFDLETSRKIGTMAKALAVARKIYRCVETAELEKIAGTLHHGGIVAVVAAPKLRAPTTAEIAVWASRRTPVLLLDRIGNAHNLGAIARTAAFFGVGNLVIPAHPGAALPNESAHRVAEGGLEEIVVWRVPDLVAFCVELKSAGYEVIGATPRGGRIGARAPGRPLALAMGNEEFGLSRELSASCTRLVSIPSRGKVESLNVSAAAAVLINSLLVPVEPEQSATSGAAQGRTPDFSSRESLSRNSPRRTAS